MEPWEVELAVDVATAEAAHRAESLDTEDIATARNIVVENDITKYDFVDFRSMATDEGLSSDEAQAAWAQLRARDVVPEGEHPNANDDEETEEETEEEATEEETEEESVGGTEIVRTDDGIAANLPEWAIEPWDVAIEPMGIGDDFGMNLPCEEGEPEVVWHFAPPEEADKLKENMEVTGANTSDGGMFTTEWARDPTGTIFNGFTESSQNDFDEAVMVGLAVCMGDEKPPGEEWEQENDNRWAREGGYSIEETAGYEISKMRGVPDNAVMASDVMAPLEGEDVV